MIPLPCPDEAHGHPFDEGPDAQVPTARQDKVAQFSQVIEWQLQQDGCKGTLSIRHLASSHGCLSSYVPT